MFVAGNITFTEDLLLSIGSPFCFPDEHTLSIKRGRDGDGIWTPSSWPQSMHSHCHHLPWKQSSLNNPQSIWWLFQLIFEMPSPLFVGYLEPSQMTMVLSGRTMWPTSPEVKTWGLILPLPGHVFPGASVSIPGNMMGKKMVDLPHKCAVTMQGDSGGEGFYQLESALFLSRTWFILNIPLQLEVLRHAVSRALSHPNSITWQTLTPPSGLQWSISSSKKTS